jgi:hypothetical protein
MKKLTSFLLMGLCLNGFAQIDTDQLSLDISKADAANTAQLQKYIWKRISTATVNGEVKLTTTTEFQYDETGKLQTTVMDAQSPVKEKPGIRGQMQENTAEDNLDYVQKALDLSIQYIFMTKGQLLDFFGKATITLSNGVYTATAKDVLIKGDTFTVKVEKSTNLFLHKEFTSLLGQDPISGSIEYAKFTNGISHGTTSVLNLPTKKAVINSENTDYSQPVK